MSLKISYPKTKKTQPLPASIEEVRPVPQTESRKFISDVVWIGLGQVFMSMTGLVVLPALTKNYPTEIFGVWAQMVATIGFLRIMTLKFESAMIRFLAAEDNKDRRRQAVSTMLWPVVLIIGVLLVISLFLTQDLSLFLFADSQFVSYVPLVLVWASLEALFLFSLSYQRVRSNNKTFSVIRLASAIARMIAVVTLATVGYSFYWIIVSVIVIQTVFVIIAFALIFKELGFFSFNFMDVKKYLVYSLPLIPGEVLWWVINVSDRYFISHLLNITQTGIYSAAASLANLLMLLSWPIGMVLFPAVSRLWETGNREKVKSYFQYSMKFFLLAAVPAAIGIYILSKPLLGILATSEYEAGAGLLVLLLAAGVTFAGVFLINEYTVYLVKKTAWLPLINGTGAVINIVINIVLIPKIGIMAAAISTAISYLVITVILVAWGRKTIKYSIDLGFIFKVIIASGIMTASLWFLSTNSIMGIVLAIIIGIAVYGLSLYLLRAFSPEDRKMIKSAFSGLGIRTRNT